MKRFSEWLAESNYRIMHYDPEGYNDFGDDEVDQGDIADQASDIVSGSGINILRDKQLTAVSRDASGRVVGALYTSLVNDEFSFDVVVAKDVQNQGIGKELVKEAISLFRSYQADDPRLKIKADVVSDAMKHILLGMGWKVKSVFGPHTIMVPKKGR